MYRLFSSVFAESYVRQGGDLQFTCYSKIPYEVYGVFIILCSRASSLNLTIVYFCTQSYVILLAPILVPQTSENIESRHNSSAI